jgi:hypothetical protein
MKLASTKITEPEYYDQRASYRHPGQRARSPPNKYDQVDGSHGVRVRTPRTGRLLISGVGNKGCCLESREEVDVCDAEIPHINSIRTHTFIKARASSGQRKEHEEVPATTPPQDQPPGCHAQAISLATPQGKVSPPLFLFFLFSQPLTPCRLLSLSGKDLLRPNPLKRLLLDAREL